MPCSRSERRCSSSGGSVGVDASVADADSSDGTAAVSDGLEMFQDGNQDMWDGKLGRRGNQGESLRTKLHV